MRLGTNGATTATDLQGVVVNPWDEALKNYEKAQQMDPGSVNGARSIAYLYNRSNEPEKARQVLDKVLEVAKTNDEKALAHSVRYDHFAATNQPDLARTELDQAIQLKPNDPDILVKAAVDALRRGDVDASRKYIEGAPGQIRSDLKLAILGEIDVRSNMDRAIEDWRKGLKATGGTNDVITWRLATVLLQLGRLSEAEPLIVQYHRLTDRAEPTPKAVYLDALLLLKKNQAAQAIPKLEAIRLKTEDTNNARRGLDEGSSLGADVAYALGQCYEAIGRDPQALDAYRDAAKIVRETRGLKWAPPWLGAANVLQRANRLDDAADELADGLIAIPDDPALLINLGRVRLFQQARLPKERRVFTDLDKILEEVRKSNPSSIDLVKLQVPYLVTADRLDEAAALLASATDSEHKPQNPELWMMQAEVLRRLGKPQQAEEALDRGTAAVGEHAVLRMSRAQALSTRGHDKDAAEILEEGVGLVPLAERPALLKALGDLRRRSDPLAARKAYAEWAKLAPQDAQPLLLMLELALLKSDEADIRTTVAAIKKIGGLAEQLANVFLLMKRPDQPGRRNQG